MLILLARGVCSFLKKITQLSHLHTRHGGLVLFGNDKRRTMDPPMTKLICYAFGLLCLSSAIFAAACASSTSASYSQPEAQSDHPSPRLSSLPDEIPVASLDHDFESNARALEDLWKVRVIDRSADASSAGFTLG